MPRLTNADYLQLHRGLRCLWLEPPQRVRVRHKSTATFDAPVLCIGSRYLRRGALATARLLVWEVAGSLLFVPCSGQRRT